MSKNTIAITTILTLILSVLLTIYYPLFTVPESVILSRFYKVQNIDKCKPTFAVYCIPENRRWQIVPLNSNIFNPLNPTFSVVYNENTGNIDGQSYKYTNVVVMKLIRQNIFDFNWKVQTDNQNPTAGLDFDRVVELVKQFNINTNNPDTSKITNRLSPTQKEIEDANLDLQNRLNEEREQNNFNNLSEVEKQKVCLQQIERQKALYQATLNGQDFEGNKTDKTNLDSIKYVIDNAKCG
jgi:hypothetical protein